MEEKYEMYVKLKNFLSFFNEINIDNDNHKNYIKLKIMTFFLYLFEFKRDYKYLNISILKKVIKALGSKPINKEILNKYIIYESNENKPLTEDSWNALNIHDFVYIKFSIFNFKINLKSYNSNILDLKDDDLLITMENKDIEFLNYDGLLNNNYIKINEEIEKEFKMILFTLLK